MSYNLIGVGNNAKTVKGDGREFVTAIMYLKPYKSVTRTFPVAHFSIAPLSTRVTPL